VNPPNPRLARLLAIRLTGRAVSYGDDTTNGPARRGCSRSIDGDSNETSSQPAAPRATTGGAGVRSELAPNSSVSVLAMLRRSPSPLRDRRSSPARSIGRRLDPVRFPYALVMRDLVGRAGLSEHIEVDSAGTGDWHAGQPPDARSVAAARARGIKVGGRARQFTDEDWERFDYVLAVDRSNFDNLRAMLPKGDTGNKLRLLRSFGPASPSGASVPDPYYSSDGFDEVIDLCIAACGPLLEHIRREHELGR